MRYVSIIVLCIPRTVIMVWLGWATRLQLGMAGDGQKWAECLRWG